MFKSLSAAALLWASAATAEDLAVLIGAPDAALGAAQFTSGTATISNNLSRAGYRVVELFDLSRPELLRALSDEAEALAGADRAVILLAGPMVSDGDATLFGPGTFVPRDRLRAELQGVRLDAILAALPEDGISAVLLAERPAEAGDKLAPGAGPLIGRRNLLLAAGPALDVAAFAEDLTSDVSARAAIGRAPRSVRIETGLGPTASFGGRVIIGPTAEDLAAAAEAALGLSRDSRRNVQDYLNALGYQAGATDGLFGPATRAALRRFQAAEGYPVTGYLTEPQARRLVERGQQAAAQQQQAQASLDRTAWATAAGADTIAAYERYLRTFPNGQFADIARRRITTLQFASGQTRLTGPDSTAWQQALAIGAIAAFIAYLDRNPDGVHSTEAIRRIRELRNVQGQTDQDAWNEARRLDTIAAYQRYLDDFPGARFANRAERRIEELRSARTAEIRAAFETAEARDTIAAYQRFIDQFPNSNLAQRAADRIAELRGQTAQGRNEAAAWQTARGADTIRAYRRYLQDYPRGANAQAAERRIAQLQDLQTDEIRAAFELAESRDTIAAYQRFIEQYPNSNLARQAEVRIAQLRAENQETRQTEADQAAFNTARQADSVAAYNRYLQDYPRGAFADAARRRIEQLQDARGDEIRAAFETAQSRDTIAAYQRFIDQYPNSNLARQAQARIEELRRGNQQANQDGQAFAAAQRTDTIAAYRQYLEAFPRGSNASAAQRRIEELQASRVAAIRQAFEQAQNQDTVQAYRRFIDQYPNSNLANRARARIEELQQPQQATGTNDADQQRRFEVEQFLAVLGLPTGPIDGRMDATSRQSLIQWKSENGFNANAAINDRVYNAMSAAVSASVTRGGDR